MLMSEHLNILPEQRVSDLKTSLSRICREIEPEKLSSLLDLATREALHRAFDQAGADEGTVWVADSARNHLIPVFNSGPNASRFVGEFRQPLDQGLISMVLATEQSFLENEVSRNARQSKLVDTALGVTTKALIAVPLY